MEKRGRQRAKEHFRQAFKTGIAGVVSICLARLFRLPEGYWAVISAVIVMQSNMGAAISAAWSRLAGTAIGAFVGAAFVALWGPSIPAFGVAVTITVLICAFLGLLDSYRLAGATVAIVTLLSRPGVSWIVALHRFLEVSLGVVVALLVTVFIWPARARKNLRQGIADALVLLHSLYVAAAARYRGKSDVPLHELRAGVARTFRNNQNLLKQTMYEPPLGPERKELLVLLMEHLHGILHAVLALEPVAREGTGDTLYRKFDPELGELTDRIGTTMERLADDISRWKFSPPEDDLSRAVASLELKAVEVRKARLTADHELEEILRFYSFFHALRNLARELDLARKAGGRWSSSSE